MWEDLLLIFAYSCRWCSSYSVSLGFGRTRFRLLLCNQFTDQVQKAYLGTDLLWSFTLNVTVAVFLVVGFHYEKHLSVLDLKFPMQGMRKVRRTSGIFSKVAALRKGLAIGNCNDMATSFPVGFIAWNHPLEECSCFFSKWKWTWSFFPQTTADMQ